jgi:hypothetical protein
MPFKSIPLAEETQNHGLVGAIRDSILGLLETKQGAHAPCVIGIITAPAPMPIGVMRAGIPLVAMTNAG